MLDNLTRLAPSDMWIMVKKIIVTRSSLKIVELMEICTNFVVRVDLMCDWLDTQ